MGSFDKVFWEITRSSTDCYPY